MRNPGEAVTGDKGDSFAQDFSGTAWVCPELIEQPVKLIGGRYG